MKVYVVTVLSPQNTYGDDGIPIAVLNALPTLEQKQLILRDYTRRRMAPPDSTLETMESEVDAVLRSYLPCEVQEFTVSDAPLVIEPPTWVVVSETTKLVVADAITIIKLQLFLERTGDKWRLRLHQNNDCHDLALPVAYVDHTGYMLPQFLDKHLNRCPYGEVVDALASYDLAGLADLLNLQYDAARYGTSTLFERVRVTNAASGAETK